MNATRTYRFLAAALVTALVVVAALWWLFSGTGLSRATVLFSRAVGVYSGSDVRLLGVRIGQVESVTPRGEQVEVTLTYDGSAPVAADTDVVVIAPSVVADRYVQFSKPARGGPRLVNHATIGLDRSATPVELDELYASLDSITKALGPDGANKNGALSDLLTTGAKNLQGNGTAFNDSVRQLAELARTLSGNSGDLFATVRELQRFTSMLAANDGQVRQVNQQLAAVSGTLAANRDELASALRSLGSALGDIQAFIKDNRALIKSNVDKLAVTTQTLADQRASLAELIETAPLAATNLLQTVDPGTGALQTRTDLIDYLPLPVTGDVYTNEVGGR
ncbi:MCE family protein [Amycolatopsis rifamycinica]|uniref:ABC transporter substrate-binding protein n=1 Tax=Amycolatopsis rifamycinica TaxID=287986 RepID=A0A066U638_9PSEU|nr:MCE family protein [Amycolatopsis rifamycinica]KDN21317.1 ABC transporter substrate-binding protein [Amycolatopsis rifamycinica]